MSKVQFTRLAALLDCAEWSNAANEACWIRALVATKNPGPQAPARGRYRRLAAGHPRGADQRKRPDRCQAVLQKLHNQRFGRLAVVLADAGYDGQPLADWTQTRCGWLLKTAPGLSGPAAFTSTPIRWVVERSVGWGGTGA